MPKILIIRFSSIGDLVLTSPVVRNVKQQLTGAEVHFCTKLKFKSVVENNPYIDKLHYYDQNFADLLFQLREEKFDYIIDLHHNLRSFLLKFFLFRKNYSFLKLNFKKWLLVNFKIDKMPKVHIVDRYMETVRKLGVVNDGKGLDYFIPEEDQVCIPELREKKYIAFIIGAQHATKKLPKEKILQLCKQLNSAIVLIGDKNDKEAADFVASNLEKRNDLIINACGRYNLNQSASLVKQSALVLAHDTGLMHIASAFRKEIYSIWGNTTPKFGMYPYQTNYKIFENNDLKCRPCSKIGYEKCPESHFKCMNENPINRIML